MKGCKLYWDKKFKVIIRKVIRIFQTTLSLILNIFSLKPHEITILVIITINTIINSINSNRYPYQTLRKFYRNLKLGQTVVYHYHLVGENNLEYFKNIDFVLFPSSRCNLSIHWSIHVYCFQCNVHCILTWINLNLNCSSSNDNPAS